MPDPDAEARSSSFLMVLAEAIIGLRRLIFSKKSDSATSTSLPMLWE